MTAPTSPQPTTQPTSPTVAGTWQRLPPMPEPRAGATATWTGTQMLIWGGTAVTPWGDHQRWCRLHATTIADTSMDSTTFRLREMISMRPIRTIATALLVASLAAAGCGRSQPDQPTSPPSQPSVVTTAPTPQPPNLTTPAPGPTPHPRVLSVTTSPALPKQGNFLRLPAGAGAITFRVRAINTNKVRFYLTPTGTGMFNENQLIGQDSNGRDGWSLAWQYRDQSLLAHLTVTAIGANGTTSPWVVVGLYHPDPAPRIVSVTTSPTLPQEGGFLRLPAGTGTVTFRGCRRSTTPSGCGSS